MSAPGNIQIIENRDGSKLAVLPLKDYEKLVDRLEIAEDLKAVDDFDRNDTGERIPHELVKKIVGGENRVKVWREFRGLTQKELAEKTGTAQPFIAQMEKGERNGTGKTLKKIAEALGLDVDILIP